MILLFYLREVWDHWNDRCVCGCNSASKHLDANLFRFKVHHLAWDRCEYNAFCLPWQPDLWPCISFDFQVSIAQACVHGNKYGTGVKSTVIVVDVNGMHLVFWRRSKLGGTASLEGGIPAIQSERAARSSDQQLDSPCFGWTMCCLHC